MKNTLSNTPTKIFKSVCTSNVYPRLPMALCLVLCTLGLGLSVNAGGTNTTITTFDAPGAGTAAARAPSLVASTLQGRLRDSPGTSTLPGTVFCALPTGPLPSSTIRARAFVQHLVEPSGTAKVRVLTPSTQPGQSPDFTPTIAPDVTATCALLTAPSPRLMLRTRAQDRFPRGPSPQNSLPLASTQQARSPDSTWTRAQYSTASCALLAARSPSSIPRAPYSPTPTLSMRWVRSRDSTLMPAVVGHGFLRAPDGAITTFDAPGAGTAGAPRHIRSKPHSERRDRGSLRRRKRCASRLRAV